MTATLEQPSPVLVDRWTWDRHFTDVGGKEYEDPRPKLTPATRVVAEVIAKHINNDSDKAWPGLREIARCAQVSLSTVQEAIKELEETGWLVIMRRPGRRSNVYRLSSPVAHVHEAREQEKEDEEEVYRRSVQGVPDIGTELRTNYPTSYKHSKDTRPTSSPANEPPVDNRKPKKRSEPMAADWTPNKFNLSLALRLGLSADLDAHAYAFRLGAHQDGEKRVNWHKAFGRYLHAFSEDRADVEFGFVDPEVVTDYALERWKAQSAATATQPVAPATDIADNRITRGEKTALNKITRYLGTPLTESETDAARSMLATGLLWNVVATEIEDTRDKASWKASA